MKFLEISGSGNTDYDKTYEGISFICNKIEDLSFTRTSDGLVITGKLDENDFTYTINNYNFDEYTNLQWLHKNGSYYGDLTKDYLINYAPTTDFVKDENFRYYYHIYASNGISVKNLTSIESLTVVDLNENSTYHKIYTDTDFDGKNLTIKNGDTTLVEIIDYADRNQFTKNFDTSDKTLIVENAIVFVAQDSEYNLGFEKSYIIHCSNDYQTDIIGGNYNDTIYGGAQNCICYIIR